MSPNIDNLPLELREKIVSLGSCETWLSIRRTNKALYQACSVPVVKEIIYNRCGGRTWHSQTLSINSPVSHWARYGLADLWASRIGSSELILKGGTRMIFWAPQLAALHHPFVTEIEVEKLESVNSNNEHMPLCSYFCYLMRQLSPERRVGGNPPTVVENIRYAREGFETSLTILGEDFLRTTKEFTKIRNHRLLSSLKRAYGALIDFIPALQEKLATAIPPRRIWNGRDFLAARAKVKAIVLPNSSLVPFSAFMDLPLPFTDDAPEEFVKCHVQKMTSASFLEDSLWAGYYSLTYPDSMSFDPPMHSIRFVVDRTESSTLHLRGIGGRDRVDAFTLEGTLDTKTGVLRMKKEYDGGDPTWYWLGIMTPFGIVAVWGDLQWGGWVWMYKVAWCP